MKNAMKRNPGEIFFQRAGGWCKSGKISDGSISKRLMMNHDGIARYSGQELASMDAETWVVP